jgi:preprotein translocase subunit Sec61beta
MNEPYLTDAMKEDIKFSENMRMIHQLEAEGKPPPIIHYSKLKVSSALKPLALWLFFLSPVIIDKIFYSRSSLSMLTLSGTFGTIIVLFGIYRLITILIYNKNIPSKECHTEREQWFKKNKDPRIIHRVFLDEHMENHVVEDEENLTKKLKKIVAWMREHLNRISNLAGTMAKNKVSMPSGMGGLTRYFDEYTSKISLKPGHVLILIALVALLVIFLHVRGYSMLGIPVA